KVIGLTATPFTPGMAEHWDGIGNGATVNFLLREKWRTRHPPEDEAASRFPSQPPARMIGRAIPTWSDGENDDLEGTSGEAGKARSRRPRSPRRDQEEHRRGPC